jgi:hypothetical protein
MPITVPENQFGVAQQPGIQAPPPIEMPGVIPPPTPEAVQRPSAPINFGSMITESPPGINPMGTAQEIKPNTFPTLQDAAEQAKNQFQDANLAPAQPPHGYGQPTTEIGANPSSFPVQEVAPAPFQPTIETVSPFGVSSVQSHDNTPLQAPNLNALSEQVAEQLKPTEESKAPPITQTFLKLNEMLSGAKGNPALEQIILKAAQTIVDEVAQNKDVPPGTIEINPQA